MNNQQHDSLLIGLAWQLCGTMVCLNGLKVQSQETTKNKKEIAEMQSLALSS